MKKNTISVIVGSGEVGRSLWRVLAPYYPVVPVDRKSVRIKENVDVMHVCIGYSDTFIEEVKRYQKKYKPTHTVIHSTVPVGTSRQCDAVHSPIIGIHPNLEEGIKTFTKFLGGEHASSVAQYFRRAGLKVYLFDKSETTELMKILDTTFYGVCIEYTKEIKRLAELYGVPFEAWSLYNGEYNRGYAELGHSEFVRPNLVPITGKIGGHCVVQNTYHLDNEFTRLIQRLNEKR